MKNQKEQQETLKRAKAKVEFRIHLISFILVNALLVVINLTQTPESLWFQWPLMGWGIGIIFHGIKVYFPGNNSIWDRMIDVEMKKEDKGQ